MNSSNGRRKEQPSRTQPIEEDRSEGDQGEAVTTILPSRATERILSGAIEDRGLKVLEAHPKHEATPERAISPVVEEKALLVLEQPRIRLAWDSMPIRQLEGEFLRFCLPLFFAEQNPIHSLGFTSAIAGEGKTSVAWLVSYALATNSRLSVVLVECDWDRPTFSQSLGLPESPGLAEYLSGASKRADIRHLVLPNLSVVPSGTGGAAALTALAQLKRLELFARLADPDELMILDLPSVLGSRYGLIAARLAESLMLVVRAGATPSSLVTRATEELRDLHVEGIFLNQVKTRIPQWLQRLI